MATETIEQVETCKDCRHWDKKWFREPKDDPRDGFRVCLHPGFKGGRKWAILLTGPESLPDSGYQCRAFEANNGN